MMFDNFLSFHAQDNVYNVFFLVISTIFPALNNNTLCLPMTYTIRPYVLFVQFRPFNCVLKAIVRNMAIRNY